MDYYERIKKAYEIIDFEVSQSTPLAIIKFKVSTKLGIGSRVVENRIKLLKEVTENAGND